METENTSWGRLQAILQQASPDLIESIKEDFKHDHVCIASFSQTIFEGGKQSKLSSGEHPYYFMKKLGFTDKELDKNRMCIISDCTYQNELCNLLNHMIGYHDMPIERIANIIPAMANDTRETKSGAQGFMQHIKQSGKGTD